MPTYPGLYRAKAMKVTATEVTALIPQVFGDASISITDFLGTAQPGMGWVFFQAGDSDHPVWCSGLGGGGGGGTVSDVVWVGPGAPADQAIELWWDTDDVAPLDPRYATPASVTAAVAPKADKTYVDTQDTADRTYTDGQFTAGIIVTPQTGWQHYGGSYGSVRVVRSGNMVTLAGLCQATVATTGGSSMVSIPAGYRPVQQILAGQLTSVGGTCRIDVTTAGVVTLNAAPAVSIPINGWVALNASWYIA